MRGHRTIFSVSPVWAASLNALVTSAPLVRGVEKSVTATIWPAARA